MKFIIRWFLALFLISLQLSCTDNNNDPEEESEEKICEIDIDTMDFTFGMDYGIRKRSLY